MAPPRLASPRREIVRSELGEIQRSLVVSRRTTLLGFLTAVGAILATQL